MDDTIQKKITEVYRTESSRVLAGLMRLLGDLDLAEEVMQEAFSVAVTQWERDGIPKNPYSWLISVGKHRAIDNIRRARRGAEIIDAEYSGLRQDMKSVPGDDAWEKYLIDDDMLRLIYYCCHPALPIESRIALSLKEVCGLSVEEIARAYLISAETQKKRLSRAKALIKEKQIPFAIPSKSDINERTQSVLKVVYLIFNEGYSASSGHQLIRRELTRQAIALARQLVGLLSTPETMGLLALLLLQESRRDARADANGDVIPLEEQDRKKWDRSCINEGLELIEQAMMSGRIGQYTLQASIASVHAVADSVENTQWEYIVAYYDMLLALTPSPVVALNRAIAVGMYEGADAGLQIINRLIEDEQLKSYHFVYAAQAEFLKKTGELDDAKLAYQRALSLTRQAPEKRYLQQQLEKIS